MPVIWLSQDTKGVQWSPHVSISAAAYLLWEQDVKLYDIEGRPSEMGFTTVGASPPTPYCCLCYHPYFKSQYIVVPC